MRTSCLTIIRERYCKNREDDIITMKVSDFHFELPPELIAQHPAAQRDHSRLMVLGRESGEISHEMFYDIKRHLRAGDCLVLNNTRVIPARLYGVKEDTGGAIEFVLLRRLHDDVWEVILKPGKRAKPGARFVFGEGALTAEILEIGEQGNRIVQFFYQGIFEEVLDRVGNMPLPPYIKEKLQDRERYQTVYSKVEGSAAAPTAGLHFTDELLEEIRQMGVETVFVTLHVGLGTFRPVKTEQVEDHPMHAEYYSISPEAAEAVNRAKAEGRRVIAVGTTSVRTLESAWVPGEGLHAGTGNTSIFIYPGFSFQVIDGLITNFHLSESTLLMLVSAFAGREHVLHAYQVAVRERYRFFSFGDAMFIC